MSGSGPSVGSPCPPRAILLDYGGVLGEVEKPAGSVEAVARQLDARLERLGVSLGADAIATDLELGMAGYEGLKRSQSRSREPTEISHGEFWELVGCDWPAPARAFVRGEATSLSQLLEAATIQRPARPDAVSTLRRLRDAGVGIAVVCNCLSGAAARDELRRDGLLDLLDVALFSDEVGMRKPGTGILRLALEALGHGPDSAWFVGDRIDRDILAARRLDVGRAILIATRAGAGTPIRGVHPDHHITALREILSLAGLASD